MPSHWLLDSMRVLVVFLFVTGAWLLFKLAHFREALWYLNAIAHNRADTRYILLACVITYSAPVILYYAWHLLRTRPHLKWQRYEFLIFGALIVAIVLNSGSPQKFIYFQF